MDFIEVLKAVIFGIVQGITEWLPISSTGHMILLDELVVLDVSAEFMEMFLVIIQFGSILAVVLLFWDKIWPFAYDGKIKMKKEVVSIWPKIVVACVPAGVIGLLWSDELNSLFFKVPVVIAMLVIFGILFLVVEEKNKKRTPSIVTMADLTYRAVIWIGMFQLIAAVLPGTSRSGATIIGALMIGVSRVAAAEFTFLLAVPVMFGASLVKLAGFGLSFTREEGLIMITGMVVAFLVSVAAIRFLMGYIKKHDFKIFGWYRIGLSIVAIIYFGIQAFT